MKNSPIQQISELTKIYGISEIEIIDLLRKAVTKSFPHKEIEVEVSNQKLIFYKTFYNRYNELKREQIKLKVEDKNKINKIFYTLLFKESQLRIFKNIKDFQKSNNGVISGKVIGKAANGFKVLTKFATAYLPFSAIPIAEKNKKIFKKNVAHYFHINKVTIKMGVLKIVLDRYSKNILLQDIKEIIDTQEQNLININRDIGSKITLYVKNKIDKESIKRLSKRYKEQVKVKVLNAW